MTNIRFKSLKNLDFLKYIPNLEELAIEYSNEKFDLSGLNYTNNLKELVLNNNELTTVEFLKGLDKFLIILLL